MAGRMLSSSTTFGGPPSPLGKANEGCRQPQNKNEKDRIKLMKKFLKNKFFIATLAVALILTTSATVLSVMGVGDPLRNIFGTLTAPLRWCATKISQGIDGYKIYFAKIDELV